MPNPRIPDELLAGPFTTARAEALGVSPSTLTTGSWRRIFHGVWVHRDALDCRELRLAAVRLILPPLAVICGITAAWLYGIDVHRHGDLDLHISFPAGKRIRQRPGLRVSQETLAPSDITTLDGLQITTPLRTAFDCARWLQGVERIVVMDALAHANLMSIGDLAAYIAGKRRLRNLRRAEALLSSADAKAESPMETRLRVLLRESGMEPVCQFEVFDNRERFVARLDLAFPDLLVAVEYDGAWHWEQRREDDRRRDRLRELGWIVLVYSADDYYKRSTELVAEVARNLRTRERILKAG